MPIALILKAVSGATLKLLPLLTGVFPSFFIADYFSLVASFGENWVLFLKDGRKWASAAEEVEYPLS